MTAAPASTPLHAWIRRVVPAIVVLVVLFVVVRNAGPQAIWTALRQGQVLPLWPLGFAIMLAVGVMVSAWDWLVIRDALGPIRYGELLRAKLGTTVLQLVGYAFGGGAYGVWIARALKEPPGTAAAVVVYVVASDLAAACTVAATTSAFGGEDVPRGVRVATTTIALVVVATLLLAGRLRARAGKLGHFAAVFARVRAKVALAQIAGRCANVSVIVCGTWVMARAFGLALPLAAVVTYLPVILVVSALPFMNLAGVGAGQAAWAHFLGRYAPAAEVVAFSFVWQLAFGFGIALRGAPFVRRVVVEIDAGDVADEARVDA